MINKRATKILIIWFGLIIVGISCVTLYHTNPELFISAENYLYKPDWNNLSPVTRSIKLDTTDHESDYQQGILQE